MNINWRIVTNEADLRAILAGWSGVIACDTETYGKAWDKEENRRLLGVSLSPETRSNDIEGVYLPFAVYGSSGWNIVWDHLPCFLLEQNFIGHNFTYDARWLLLCNGESTWTADTRIMWHLASAPAGPRPYGLKDAQKELLGWPETNEKELSDNVKAKGGSLRNGDHYLADLDILAKYACLDTYSTMQVYKRLKPFFDKHAYWPLLRSIMAYNAILEENTYRGVGVDKEGLQKAHKRLLGVKEAARKRFFKGVSAYTESLEEDWKDRKVAEYKREYNKTHYLASPEKWLKFNLNSDAHKRELFYGKMGFPVTQKTDSGRPSTAADAIKNNNHPSIEAYLKYEKANTLTSNFSGPYLDSTPDGRLHPGFNICGTVSYRLSGFKPYLLNAPFDATPIMKNIVCDPGFVGVHADLSSIEPCLTAHYSEDPALIKVFRDGLGDIYLDLALTLFPNDKELQEGYNSNIPITKAVKECFSKQRKVAKTIQLAVQYTGTGHTVSKNLTKDGIPTTVAQADRYVAAYWQKFYRVANFNSRLQNLNARDGLLRNVIGRIIRVPSVGYKDLPNRFIQSSAHDVLLLWVLKIYERCKEEGIDIRPMLVDCHDSTSNQCPIEQVDALQNIYLSCLQAVNTALDLSVDIKCELKTFRTFAGLKQDE